MRTKAVAASVLALAVLTGGLEAGPLALGGPVSSAYKTLGEVEPRIAINGGTGGNGMGSTDPYAYVLY